MKRVSTGAACLLAVSLSGCATPPAGYATTLSADDPKWRSPQCERARVAATEYEDKSLNMGVALILGPYGLALAAASREQAQKQRKQIARDVHESCSSLPLPHTLRVDPSSNG